MLTNDSIKYQIEIKKRLTSNFEIGWQPLWCYSELMSMLIEGQSIFFLMKENISTSKLIHRTWKMDEQEENTSGIYSFDNIKIKEEEIHISLNDLFEIQNLLNSDLQITPSKGVVLDGIDFELIDFKTNRQFKWKLDEEINRPLSVLINKIKEQKKT